MEPGTLAARAKTFQASIPRRGFVTMIVQRSEVGLLSLVVAPDTAQASTTVAHLAAATASTAADYPLDGLNLEAPVVGRWVFGGGRVALRDTQVGADMAGVAQVLGRALTPGSWVAVTVRSPSRSETERWVRWLKHRMEVATPHHHSAESNAVVMSVHAGGRSRSEVESLLAQVAAAMPGFDLPVRAVIPSTLGPVVWGTLAAVVAGGAAGVLENWWAAGLLAAMCVASGLIVRQRAASVGERWRVLNAVARRPSARLIPPRRPGTRDRGEGRVVQFDGDYPLDRTSFLVGAHLPLGVVAPHSGALVGASQTAMHPVPPTLRHRVGPRVGRGSDGTEVHLSARDMFAGTLLLGQAGSGKSVAVRQLFAWHLLERLQPSGMPGAPGRECAIVAFESKRDGAQKYLEWSDQFGKQALLVDVMDPATYAIDLVPPGDTLELRARALVDQMQYAFGSDAIGYRSHDTLVALAMGALVVDEPIARLAGEKPGLGVFHYMAVLVEAFGDDRQASLYGAIASEAVRRGPSANDLHAAYEYLRGFFDGPTPAQRRAITEAPRSKIKPLLALGSWWEDSRPRVTWSQLLQRHGVAVVNVGASIASSASIDSQVAEQLQAMMMSSLRATIKTECDGWQDQGRSIAIFSDELSLLAGNSPEVVTWLRDQGRSYGVRPVFALQYPEQLDQRVRTSVLGFANLFALKQSNPQVARDLAADFAADGTAWDPSDVVNLSNYSAIARLADGQARQPAFTVALDSWESTDRREGFARDQGYAL